MANRKPIDIVIAGLGRAGWDIHWKQLLKGHPDFRVVAAIEPVEARRVEAEEEIGCRTYALFDQFVQDPVGEVIVLATPSGGMVLRQWLALSLVCMWLRINLCARELKKLMR